MGNQNDSVQDETLPAVLPEKKAATVDEDILLEQDTDRLHPGALSTYHHL